MPDDTRKLVYAVIGGALAIAAGWNGFFIQRLVESVDSTREMVYQLRGDFREEIASIKSRLGEPRTAHRDSVKSCNKKGEPS